MTAKLKVYLGDNLPILKTLSPESIDLIYIDPPFNTGRVQLRERFHTDKDGNKVEDESYGYQDSYGTYGDFLEFIKPRLEEAKRILKPTGSIFVHLDYRQVHYVKVTMDILFGSESFMNEIIWSYDYGGRSKSKWSAKHDNILWYAKDPKHYTFNYDAIDRIPYLAPNRQSKEKAELGKTPTDVWWHTIVHTNSKEKTGYATQKPRGIIDRIVKVHSNPGDQLLDFFAGSGTFGESAATFDRNAILIDANPDAITVMRKRFQPFATEWIV